MLYNIPNTKWDSDYSRASYFQIPRQDNIASTLHSREVFLYSSQQFEMKLCLLHASNTISGWSAIKARMCREGQKVSWKCWVAELADVNQQYVIKRKEWKSRLLLCSCSRIYLPPMYSVLYSISFFMIWYRTLPLASFCPLRYILSQQSSKSCCAHKRMFPF